MTPTFTFVRILAAACLVLAAGTLAACGDDKTATPAPATATMTATAAASPVAKVGDIELYAPFGRSPGTPAVAGFFVQIKNTGSDDDSLIAASVPAAISDTAELHNTVMENGNAEMKPVDKIDVPAEGVTALAPGGYHIMVVDLKRALKVGEMIDVTLKFEKAGEVTMSVPIVEYVADMGDSSSMDGTATPMP